MKRFMALFAIWACLGIAGCSSKRSSPEVMTPTETQGCYAGHPTAAQLEACLKAHPVQNAIPTTRSVKVQPPTSRARFATIQDGLTYEAVMAVLSGSDADVAQALQEQGFTPPEAEAFYASLTPVQLAEFNAACPPARVSRIMDLLPQENLYYYAWVYYQVFSDGMLPSGW